MDYPSEIFMKQSRCNLININTFFNYSIPIMTFSGEKKKIIPIGKITFYVNRYKHIQKLL